MAKTTTKKYPFIWMLGLYIGTMCLFTLFYLLPVAQNNTIPFIDALFLSASGMSVTGLSSINITTDLSFVGKAMLLIQIQMGGVGIMVFVTYSLLFLGKKLSLPQLIIMSQDQNTSSMKSIKSIMFFILPLVLVIEVIGFICMYPTVSRLYDDPIEAAFLTLFHSVSSFTNAGFDLFGITLLSFTNEAFFLIVTGVLLFLGVIGFPVIYELLKRPKKRSLFTKTNLIVHAGLIVMGFLLLMIFEMNNRLSSFSMGDKLLNALFLSITARNGGITTLEIGMLSSSSVLLLLFLMFVGASPSSCGGGIKTTTFAVLIAKSWSSIKGREDTVLFKRNVPYGTVNKSILVFFSYLFLFFFSTMVLSSVEQVSLEKIAFEVMSALTTTGLSMGITDDLTSFSKVWLILLMLIGRIGIISWIYLVVSNKPSNAKYISENIAVG